MTVNYIGKKTVIRDSFKEYAEKRLKKLGKFFDDDPVVNIIVTNHNEDETVEVTIQSHGMFFRAERTSDDRQTSLDLVLDVLQKQIVRNKERLEKRLKSSMDFTAFSAEEVLEEAVPATELVKTKKFHVETMDAEEAILQMNMLGHTFFLFRSPETGEINVVYRRKDGNQGLLQPLED
mgnify:FL=1